MVVVVCLTLPAMGFWCRAFLLLLLLLCYCCSRSVDLLVFALSIPRSSLMQCLPAASHGVLLLSGNPTSHRCSSRSPICVFKSGNWIRRGREGRGLQLFCARFVWYGFVVVVFFFLGRGVLFSVGCFYVELGGRHVFFFQFCILRRLL